MATGVWVCGQSKGNKVTSCNYSLPNILQLRLRLQPPIETIISNQFKYVQAMSFSKLMAAARHRVYFIDPLFFSQQVACRSSSGANTSGCPTMKSVDARWTMWGLFMII